MIRGRCWLEPVERCQESAADADVGHFLRRTSFPKMYLVHQGERPGFVIGFQTGCLTGQ